MMDYESPAEAWEFLRCSMPVFAFMGAVIGGPIIYYQERIERNGNGG